MKKLIKQTAAPLVLALFSFSACDSDYAGRDLDGIQVNAPDSQIKAALEEDPNLDFCAYEKRKTVDFVKEKVAFIELMDRDEALYVMTIPDEGKRYHACNLPASMLRPGTMVKISGEVKEVYENEKWLASPFKISNISDVETAFKIEDVEK